MGQAISNIFGDGKGGRDENSYQETKRRVVVEGRRGSDGTQQTIPNSFQPNPNWDWVEILNSSTVVQSSRRGAIVQECGQIGGTQQNVPIRLHPELKSSSNTRLSTCPAEVEDSSRIRVVEESDGSGGIQKNLLKNLRSELESSSKTWISTCSSKVEDSSRKRVVAVTCGSGGTQQNILRSLQFELEPSSNIRTSTCSSKVEDSSKIKVVEESGGSGGAQQNVPKSTRRKRPSKKERMHSSSNDTRLYASSSTEVVESSISVAIVQECGQTGGTQQNVPKNLHPELKPSSDTKISICPKVVNSSRRVVEERGDSGGTHQNILKSLQSQFESGSNTRLSTCSSKVEDSSRIKVVEESGGTQQNVPKSSRRKRPSKKERMHSSGNDTRPSTSSSTKVDVSSKRVVEESSGNGGTLQNVFKSSKKKPCGNKKILHSSSNDTVLSTSSTEVLGSSRRVVEESSGNALLSTHLQQQQIHEPPTAGSVSKVLVATMAVTFYNLNSQSGLNKLDEYLLTRSYISGYQASKDDITVHAALSSPPLAKYVNASRWYKHIDALLRISGVFGDGSGVTMEGFAPVAEEIATAAVIYSKADDDHNDDDVDVFDEETKEEKKVAEEPAVAIKASGNKKESGKLSILLDVKPCSQGGDTQQSIPKSLQLELKSSSNTRLNTCLHLNGRVLDENGQSGVTQQNVPKSPRRKPCGKEILHSSNNARLSTSNKSTEDRVISIPKNEETMDKLLAEWSQMAVKEDKQIKHYRSSHKILLVGEGDFSFSACLAKAFGCAANMVATSLDSIEFLELNYGKAISNINELKKRGCMVMHGFDVHNMANRRSVKGKKFDRIIYNFPLAGFFHDKPKEYQLRRNKTLMKSFFKNAKLMLSKEGEIHVSHKCTSSFRNWDLETLASENGLQLIAEAPFKLHHYPGYDTKYGFGGDENFNCNPSNTYKFVIEHQTLKS